MVRVIGGAPQCFINDAMEVASDVQTREAPVTESNAESNRNSNSNSNNTSDESAKIDLPDETTQSNNANTTLSWCEQSPAFGAVSAVTVVTVDQQESSLPSVVTGTAESSDITDHF